MGQRWLEPICLARQVYRHRAGRAGFGHARLRRFAGHFSGHIFCDLQSLAMDGRQWRARGQYVPGRRTPTCTATWTALMRRTWCWSRSRKWLGRNRRRSIRLADPDVIAVTATDSRNDLFKAANPGTYVAVAAPGVDILALAPRVCYQITKHSDRDGEAAGRRRMATFGFRGGAGGCVWGPGVCRQDQRQTVSAMLPDRPCLLSRSNRRDTISAHSDAI
jgi:hypothetical protein